MGRLETVARNKGKGKRKIITVPKEISIPKSGEVGESSRMASESDSNYVPREEEVDEDDYEDEKEFEPEANTTTSSKTKESMPRRPAGVFVLFKYKKVEYKIKAGFHRSTILKFIEIVAKLNSKKRKDVEDIGFGVLLELKCSHLSTPLFNYLIEQFKADKCGIKLKGNQLLPINAFEVHNILGLPAGIMPVPTSHQFCTDWIDEGGYQESLYVGELMKRVIECEAGDDFKKAFLLCACATVLTPNGHYHSHVQELLAVDNVKAISSYNWCLYVVDHVVGSLGDAKLKSEYVGCLIFLQLLYLMRCQVKYPCYPTRDRNSLAYWDDGLVCDRLKWEEQIGGFGNGQEIRKDVENTKTLKRKVKEIETLMKKKSKKDCRGEEQQSAGEPRDEKDREDRETGAKGESFDGDVF
ncbi:uncharacterized protein LOC132304912 [Cornus florida]|uniref:uncharacterized protein LOC132304912 n=1 Tax=Cornus florida TaxID=4283 RepID=UPI0028974DFA|nr:uncharacterized protein LOC132304912 [Cornus florida]